MARGARSPWRLIYCAHCDDRYSNNALGRAAHLRSDRHRANEWYCGNRQAVQVLLAAFGPIKLLPGRRDVNKIHSGVLRLNGWLS